MDLPALPGYVFEPTLAGVLSTVITFLLPLLAGLLSKQSWSPSVKGVVLLLLSAIKVGIESFIQASADGAHVNVYGIIYSVAINFIVAVGMYFGVLRGSGVQRAAANSGVTDP